MGRNRKITQSDIYQETKKILEKHGYAGFHFGLLAERLDVTRAALYKYFSHKDELITEFMNVEMRQLVTDLEQIAKQASFGEKFDYLLDVIAKHNKTHQILSKAFQVEKTTHPVVKQNLEELNVLHRQMYTIFQKFVQLGKREGYIREDLPNDLMIGFLLQTVNIPNRTELSDNAWQIAIKQFLLDGFFPK